MQALKGPRARQAITVTEMLRVAGSAAPYRHSDIATIQAADKSAMLSVRMMKATLGAPTTYTLGPETSRAGCVPAAQAQTIMRAANRAVVAGKAQDYACAIYRRPEPNERFGKLAMHHCREPGLVRELHHTRCNLRPGYREDDADRKHSKGDGLGATQPQQADLPRSIVSYIGRIKTISGRRGGRGRTKVRSLAQLGSQHARSDVY